MEESNEMHSEENKASLEKNKKRQLKTPAQVAALEEFYNEHKYPSEELKSQLAEQIGLTEKQVSGWFCHRRLKEKRLVKDEAPVNGRQDRSSGVFQDRGSGLRQDSCGSTKQGDYRHVDPREVESQRFNRQHFLAADNAYERRSHYPGSVSGDDTSSESSSSLQEGFNSQRVDTYDMESSRYSAQNGVAIPNSSKGAKNIAYKPAGYLKVKGEAENVAITAVKRQLGRNYREDGPQLGVKFQPLPPGAFESSIRESVREPYDVGSVRDPAPLHSPDTSGIRKQPRLATDLHLEGASLSNFHGSDCHDKSQRRLKHKSSNLNHINAFPGQNSLDNYEDSAGDTRVYNSKKKERMTSKHGMDGIISDSVSNHPPRPYGAKSASERSQQTEAWLQEDDYVSPKGVQRNEYLKSPLNVIPGHEPPDTEKGASRRMAKDGRFHVERLSGKEYHDRDPVRAKTHPRDELVSKRVRDESQQKTFAAKASIPELPLQANETKGSALEMPSSFSEDETAETSSSLD